jgi:hypothetical protein
VKRVDFDLKKPCANCPFLRGDKAVRLRHARITEIHNTVTGAQGGIFPCHKTVSDEEREAVYQDLDVEDEMEVPQPSNKPWQYCAGALVYALKQQMPNQLTRVALRLRTFDPDALLATPEAANVFDNLREWKRTAVDYDEEEEAEQDERICCSVANGGCEAPAGYLVGGDIAEGDGEAENECSECGEPVCGSEDCATFRGDGRVVCYYCSEDG